MTDAIFDSSYLVSNETQHSSERRIDINGTTLAFSPEAQQQMHELDELIINLETAAEIVGFGLANSDKTDEVRITEFVAPKPENIFNLNTFMINQDEKKLAQIFSNCFFVLAYISALFWILFSSLSVYIFIFGIDRIKSIFIIRSYCCGGW